MTEDKISEMRDTLIAISIKMDDVVKMVEKVEQHENFINQMKGGIAVIGSISILVMFYQLAENLIKIIQA